MNASDPSFIETDQRHSSQAGHDERVLLSVIVRQN
jgi:hypothetical protein